ncbi:MAG: TRAP transporter large permease [Succinivibrionaceae bacterium]|nr:TRAP transporter large permease [Succinivibrionaceae bacterium]
MEIFIFIGSLFALLITGIPVAIVLMLCAAIMFYVIDLWDPLLLAQQMLQGADSFILTAVPFFMLAGEIMKEGGISNRLISFGQVLVGRFNGGMGYVAILASMLFAGLSGAAIADVAALGAVLIPMMVKCGYNKPRSTGLICASALTAPIIPPSIPLIILGVTVNLSIGRLFIMGIAPGICLGLILMLVWYFVVKRDKYNDRVVITGPEALRTFFSAIPALMLPIIIIVGIRFGIFTPTEGGAVAAVYAFVVAFFIHRELKLKECPRIFFNAVRTSAVVMFLVSTAYTIGWLITMAQVPDQIVGLLEPLVEKPFLLLIILNVVLVGLGMVMDITPIILIFAPVFYPLVNAAGIDPYYFALLMVLNLSIGLLTPPMGSVLFVGCSVAKMPITKLVAGVFPFLIAEMSYLALCIFFPAILTAPAEWMAGN